MDQKNLILAIVLSVVIMLGWQYFYADRFAPPPGQQHDTEQTAGTPEAPDLPDGTAPAAPAGDVPAAGQPAVPGGLSAPAPAPARSVASQPRIRITSDRLLGSISLTGARLDDLVLLNYRQTIEPDSPNVRLLHRIDTPRPYFADFGWVSADTQVPPTDAVWTANKDVLSPGNPVRLSWTNAAGVTFMKEISLDRNYLFTVNQRVENNSDKPVTVFPFGRVNRTGTPDITDFFILHEGLIGVLGGTLKETDYDDIQDDKLVSFDSQGGWLGITDKYWLAALIPDQQAKISARFLDQTANNTDRYQVDFRGEGMAIPAAGAGEVRNHLFAGAKEVDVIFGYRDTLNITRFDLAIDWGFFSWLTKPTFFILDYFTGFLGNMGLSILLLTVLVKLVFFPLANKSYRAMGQMRKLQPEMMKLRERFADDRQRMNQEVMALYKREKANPASGCLPILPQIPVFFAIYKVVFITIELRQAPFFGWIKDLSAMDPLTPVNLFGLIPWTPPEIIAIGVWPIIMGITMWAQQMLNPPPPDPMQAKIFMFLPIIFTFMLARFPSGLVIYWAWNNLLSVIQQYVIMKKAGAPIGRKATQAQTPTKSS